MCERLGFFIPIHGAWLFGAKNVNKDGVTISYLKSDSMMGLNCLTI